MKIDIGSGPHRYEGYTPWDWSLEGDARVLPYEDNSLEEIRASHVLEHIPRHQVNETLRHWVSKLKPGGILRIAVPDFDEIIRLAIEDRDNPKPDAKPFPWELYIMGAGIDAQDIHYTIWNRPKLEHHLTQAGLSNIVPWAPQFEAGAKLDCSAHSFSLNLQGTKPNGVAELPPPDYSDIRGVMTMPRLAWTDNMFCVSGAMQKLKISVQNSIGVFYGQGIQRVLENCCESTDLKYALTIDYDSIFDWRDVVALRQIADQYELDAIAPMQAGRERSVALFSAASADGKARPVTSKELDSDCFPISTAHFGLTLIRLDSLRKLPKPWFKSEPNDKGSWDTGKIDDDIWFWKQANAAGWKTAIAPKVHIGHIETVISWVTSERSKEYQSMFSWLRGGKPWWVRNREAIWRNQEPERPA